MRGQRIGFLRGTLFLLAGVGTIGTAAELALDRHWHDVWQLLPWVALGGIVLALMALLFCRTPATVWLARTCAAVAIAMAVVGVWRHADANYEAAPLDFRYADRWETMSGSERWLEVVKGSVGPSPMLASGVLLYIGVALGAATSGLGKSPAAATEVGQPPHLSGRSREPARPSGS